MTTTEISGATSVGAPTRTSGLRRVACALAMLVGPWGFAVTNAAYAWSIKDGGNEDTGAATLALYGAHPGLVHTALTAGMLACLLVVPAVMGVLRLAPTSRLVLVGGSMMVAGYVCYFAVLNSGFGILAMAQHGGPVDDFAQVVEETQKQGWTVWVFALFVLGNLVGTTLLASGLLRSRAVPRWAALGILSWPPLHVVGLVFFGNEVPQVIGAVLQALGFAGCALVLLRRQDR